MRPAIASAARTGSALGEAASASTRAFVCRDCIARGAAPAAAQGQRRSYAEKKKRGGVFDSENWRKKIWGTENPPGAKDPYAQSQFAPQQPEEAVEQQEQEQELEEARFYDGNTLEEAKAFDPEYEPAETWKGLKKVGGAKGWWEEVWDQDHPFQRWAAPTAKNLEPKVAADYIHRAFIEIKVLQQAGLDINDASFLPIESEINYNQVSWKSTNQDVQLSFPNDSWREEIIDLVREDEGNGDFVEESPDAVTPTAAEAEAVAEDLAEPIESELAEAEKEALPQTKSKKQKTKQPERIDWADNADWRHTRIPTDAFKFALVKRVMQLTGHRIPDAAIARSRELGILMQEGFKWQKPTQLAKALLTESKDFKTLGQKWTIAPNVMVHKRRQTYVDREKTVGRWKVVKEELLKRDLPIPRRAGKY